MTLIDTYKLLAEVELELNAIDKALTYSQQALSLAQETDNHDFEGVAYRALGQAYYAAQDLEQAQQQFERSIEILTNAENQLELARSHYELGLVRSATGSANGPQHLEVAIQIFRDLGVAGELAKAEAALQKTRDTCT